jgi:hypothetical protein
MNNTAVEDYIEQQSDNQKEILYYFHNYLLNLNLNTKISYRIPFYYNRSWICYLNPIKGDGIELAFPRGNELSNSKGILLDKGRKQVLGIDIFKLSDCPLNDVREIIHEAIFLDETVTYQSKRKKK